MDQENNRFNMESLSDEEIKNMIIDINKKQLNIVKDMSYFYVIGQIPKKIYEFEIENLLDYINIINEKNIINKSLKVINNSFDKYHLDLSDEEIMQERDTLINVRKELYKLLNSLYGYGIELSYIKEILDYKMMKNIGKEYKESYKISEKDIHYLVNRIGMVLDNKSMNYNDFIKLVSNILLIIPFRMTKSKYYEVLKGTIMRNLSGYPIKIVEDKIEEYKRIFDSTLLGDYGILFDEFFTNIQKLKNEKLDSVKPDEIENIKKNIAKLDNEINKIDLFIGDLGIIINRLIVLYLTKNRNESKQEGSIYNKYKEFQKNKDKELLDSILELSSKGFEENEKDLLSRTKDLERLVHQSTKRKITFEDELNNEFQYTKRVLVYYNDIKFTKNELLDFKEYEIINEMYLEQLINSLIYYINRSISNMDNVERKIRMRRLLSIIELPFKNIDEFLDYIEYSFDERIVSKEEILYTFYSLNHLLDEINNK